MNRLVTIVWLLLLPFLIDAQKNETDSLLSIIGHHKGDTTEVNTLAYLAAQQTKPDTIFYYAQQGMALAQKLHYTRGEANCLLAFHLMNVSKGNFADAVKNGLDALSIYKKLNDAAGIASTHLVMQGLYWNIDDYRTALSYSIPGEQFSKANNVVGFQVFPGHHLAPLFASEIAQVYVLLHKLDSALYWIQQSIDQKELFKGSEWNFPIYLLATIQTMQGNYANALANFRKAYPLAIANDFRRDTLQIFAGMSTLFRKMEQYDSSLHYAHTVVTGWSNESEYKNLAEALNNLAEVYKRTGRADSALKYLELSQAIKDSIFTGEKNREIEKVAFAENLKQQQLISDQLKYKNKVQLYSFIAGAFILILIALVLWRNNEQQKKAKIKIQNAYSKLKTTQAQLIQSEKMASLGELTAGIAHEIQNPLNFVNNFAALNAELLAELKSAIANGNDKEDVLGIVSNVLQNEEKIAYHGGRADAIVKNMLQHSRHANGEKQLADINAIANEYLRLSYQAMLSKDKNFRATIRTDFDESIDKINVVPQDIGRVLLNLFNNAFYAVNEKRKRENGSFNPLVVVNSKKMHDRIEIGVKDNGVGIPKKLLNKIFQPFFTTKPTGEGTGLGLSLSYDIITKEHGGELLVDTKEGEGATFIIRLPLQEKNNA